MKISTQLQKLIKEEEIERGYHIFSNRHRREIFRELTRAPCQTSSSLMRKLGYDVQNVEWHLKRLMREGFVDLKIYKKKLFCPSELIFEEDIPLFHLLNTRSGWIIVRSLVDRCRDMPYLSKHASRATAYRVVDTLKSLNLVDVSKGTRKMICLNEGFYEKMDMYSVQGSEFKKNFIKRIEKRGYSAEIVGSYDYEIIIRLSGMENFTLGIFISPLKTILGVKK